MSKYPLIGGSICAVVLLVLASLTNVVGYQTAQASNQKTITTELNEKDLLFQTIIDMANNKEIQRVILSFEYIGKRSFNSGMRFSVYTPQILTKRFLNFTYQMGLILSKTISKSKIHSLLEKYQINNQLMQKEINAVVEKDVTLKAEMTQLLEPKCDCENENTTRLWNFPGICLLLFPLFIIGFGLYIRYNSIYLLKIISFIGVTLNCFWTL